MRDLPTCCETESLWLPPPSGSRPWCPGPGDRGCVPGHQSALLCRTISEHSGVYPGLGLCLCHHSWPWSCHHMGCKLGAGNSSAAQDLLKKGCGGCGNPSFRAGICSIAVLGSSCLWWRQQFGAAAAVSSASHAGNQGPTGAGGDNADPVQRCILFCRHPGEQKGCYLG